MRAAILILALAVVADDPPPFRKDGGDEKLPWFQLKPGEFPPDGAAHEISGELIGVDPVARSGTLRGDRNDSQRTDDYDAALPFTQLPYARTMGPRLVRGAARRPAGDASDRALLHQGE